MLKGMMVLLLSSMVATASAAGSPAVAARPFDLPCLYDSRRESMTALKGCAKLDGDRLRLRPFVLAHAAFDRHGLTEVHCGGFWWYARRDGHTQRMATMDNGPDYFNAGLARAVVNGKTGFVDQRLRFVIPARYDNAMPFDHGRADVCNGCVAQPEGEHSVLVGGLWGVVDRTGREVEPLRPAAKVRH